MLAPSWPSGGAKCPLTKKLERYILRQIRQMGDLLRQSTPADHDARQVEQTLAAQARFDDRCTRGPRFTTLTAIRWGVDTLGAMTIRDNGRPAAPVQKLGRRPKQAGRLALEELVMNAPDLLVHHAPLSRVVPECRRDHATSCPPRKTMPRPDRNGCIASAELGLRHAAGK